MVHIETTDYYIFTFDPPEDFWNNPPLFKASYDPNEFEDTEEFLEKAQFYEFAEEETVQFFIPVFYYEENKPKEGFVKMSGVVYPDKDGFEFVIYDLIVKPTSQGLGTAFFKAIYPKFTQHNWRISVDEGQTDEGRSFFRKMYKLGYIIR